MLQIKSKNSFKFNNMKYWFSLTCQSVKQIKLSIHDRMFLMTIKNALTMLVIMINRFLLNLGAIVDHKLV